MFYSFLSGLVFPSIFLPPAAAPDVWGGRSGNCGKKNKNDINLSLIVVGINSFLYFCCIM